MADERFDILAFSRRRDAVAAAVPGHALFGLVTRRLSLPARWIALVTGGEGETWVRGPGGEMEGDGVREVMFVRVDSSELRFCFKGIASSDGYQCEVTVVLDVHVVDEKSELSAFRRTVLGSRGEATVETLAQQLHWHVRRAVVAYGGGRSASVLVDGKHGEAFGTILKEQVAGVCFASGLAVERCGGLRVVCPGWHSVRQEQEAAQAGREKAAARQQLREALEAAQRRHVRHVEELLEQLKKLSEQSPEVRLGDLVRTFREEERGQLYEALWSSEAAEGRTRWVAAAAGKDVILFEPGLWKRPAGQMTLAEVGPLRSIQAVRQESRVCLLAGASRGVYLLDADRLDEREAYVFDFDPDRPIRGGVNAATIVGHCLLATHSEVGLVRWALGERSAAERMIPELTAGAKAVRLVQRFGSDLWLSVDDGVLRLPDSILMSNQAVIYIGSNGPVTALCVSGQGVFAGNSHGDVLRWPFSDPSAPEVVHRGRGRPAETVWIRSSAGVDQLLFADGGPALGAMVLGDTFVCGYDGAGEAVRRAEIADDIFVGLNEARDRVLCWLPHQPGEPAAVLPLATQLAHRVQDVCLVPET